MQSTCGECFWAGSSFAAQVSHGCLLRHTHILCFCNVCVCVWIESECQHRMYFGLPQSSGVLGWPNYSIKLQKVLRTRAHIGIDPQKLTKIDCIDTMPTTCAIIPSMPCVCYLCALHGGLGKAEGWVMLYGDCSGCWCMHMEKSCYGWPQLNSYWAWQMAEGGANGKGE